MMILSQAAPFDMATTSGIAQSVTLRFVDGAGAAKDISSHEFRCAVRGPGAAAIKCEPVDANTALLSWSPLKAGTHAYDLFMTSPDGAERPLIKGEIHAASRVTPPGSEDVVTIGDVKIMIPDAAEGEVKIIDPSVDAAERAESAAQEASNARNDAQNAKKEAEKSAESAATSATSAANSATEAQQVLEAIPEVDASGNMTLAGGLTAAGAINANGGVNIPLAVGAVTDTSAVNRLYAAGMAGVTGILTSNAFLNTDAITASGSSTVTKTVPYHLAGIKVPKGTHSTIQARFEVSNPQWNYSSFAGFSFLWRATNAAKLSFGIGRGGKTIRPDLSIDSYSIIPANGLAYNHGEILDITFDNVRNTDRNGYTVRVREIFALNNTDSWQVKTTTSFVPASQNEPVPWTIAKIIYQQKSVASIARYEDTGALWLMLTGGQGNNLYQIATCRGVSNFETGVGVSQWVTDVVNNAAGDVSVYAGTGEYTYYHPGNVNPVFYGLDAISRNCIETEETADFVDINIPL
ncbi:MAG: hypothetical protein ACLUXT_06005 [Akkermansia muciniphila]